MFKSVVLLLCLTNVIVCPPPMRQQAQAAQAAQANNNDGNSNHNQPTPAVDSAQNSTPQPTEDDRKPLYGIAYSKYLEEVVQILESDPKFAERLSGMKEEDIKSGKIADQIDDLDTAVYDKLHKAKFQEIERLRQQIAKQIEADGGAHNVKMPEHLDIQNLEKFHKEDLRKLIVKTVADMNEIDKQRREEFKEYEMKKKAEEDHKLAHMAPEEREKEKHNIEEAKKRHNEHEKLKHPGSRDQLEEVWEESDHLDKDSFDPRTFFALHDLNGDGFWNDDELEALFQIELEKMYNDTNPDDDPKERMEEMYRMREHVSQQMDKNGDRMISLEEFLADTEAQTPNKDEGWQDLGDQQVYTDEELQKFEQEYAKQQGWGENAYAEVEIPSSDHKAQQQPNAVNQPPVQAQHNYPNQQQQQQVHPAQNNPPPPPPPQQPQQTQQIHQQQAQPQQNLPPVHHEPIQDHQKDPAYGI